MNGINSPHANYLIVTTRTGCLLYLIQASQAKRLCSYIINARKNSCKKKNDNKYSHNVRYYFTSAKVTVVSQQSVFAKKRESSRAEATTVQKMQMTEVREDTIIKEE